jgi:hypothetical protein
MKVLIITSCTGEKLHSPNHQLTQEDFRLIHDNNEFQSLEDALSEYRTSAEEIYTGQQHIRLMQGVRALRDSSSKIDAQLWILSAGYGLIPGHRSIVPYECTFQGMKRGELRNWAEHLNVADQSKNLFSENADLILVLLGDSYLKALNLDDSIEFKSPTLFLTSEGARKQIKGKGKILTVLLSNKEAKRFSCGLVGLKGELVKRILTQLSQNGDEFLEQLLHSDSDILTLIEDKETVTTTTRRFPAKANPQVDRVIEIPQSWWQKPHREKLKYFIPEWDDLVDPNYDFESDTHSGGSGDWSNEVYAHQLYSEPNYDGILISKVVAEKSKKKKERINALGVHRFLRVPREFPIMGDCGAFGYIMEEKPPYTTDEILDYYTRLDFDYGVSIDHLIVKATEEQKRFRYELTIHNAEEFLREHRKRGLNWEPIGAVQGWDSASYAEAARQYVAMGYKYIAIGGLVRTNTQGILRIIQKVQKVVPGEVKIHLFGIARFQAMNDFIKLGVSSIDSASMLRKAWLGSDLNILTLKGWYSAIRIPQSEGSYRAKIIIEEGKLSLIKLKQLEKQCLGELRKYAANPGNPTPELVQLLADYDTLVAGERKRTRERIQRTLEDRPWESCGCAICKRWGVEVAVFRGNNRNRRRGFHNTHIFYQLMEKKISGEPISWLDTPPSEETAVQQGLFEVIGA